jgi:ferredoxin
MISVFSRVGFLGLRRDPVKCGKCRECVERCPMAVRILDLPWEKFTDPDCTMCLACRDACPGRAIRLRFS